MFVFHGFYCKHFKSQELVEDFYRQIEIIQICVKEDFTSLISVNCSGECLSEYVKMKYSY